MGKGEEEEGKIKKERRRRSQTGNRKLEWFINNLASDWECILV